jgi:hypothetical protein
MGCDQLDDPYSWACRLEGIKKVSPSRFAVALGPCGVGKDTHNGLVATGAKARKHLPRALYFLFGEQYAKRCIRLTGTACVGLAKQENATLSEMFRQQKRMPG